MRRFTELCFIVVLSLVMNEGSSAQKYEVDAYGGAFFPGKFADVIELDNESIFGVRTGVFLRRGVLAEGNFGYINHLNFRDTLTQKRAYIWDGSVTYHVGKRRTRPYETLGAGVVRTTVSNDARALFGPNALPAEHFFALNFGGGVKTIRRWGPLGYRVDVRERLIPRYYGFQFHWIETTAGLTIAWGER